MSEGRKTLPLRETGTVPKAKYLKNTPLMQEIHVSNNLQVKYLFIKHKKLLFL